MASAEVNRIRLSTVLQRLAQDRAERIEVARLLDVFGERAFGALLFVLAVPNLVLLPPGASALFGVPLMLVAAQLAWGRKSVWLPQAIRRRSFDRMLFQRAVSVARPYLRRAERLLAPRFVFMFGGFGTRLIGLGCFVLAVLIALPIPLANFLSGLAIAAFALALIQHDGVAAVLGWVCALVSAAATVLVSGAVWIVGREALERFREAM
ncbi:MAG: exopolysaccharide biosynthesis protein [Propylenella sp.]